MRGRGDVAAAQDRKKVGTVRLCAWNGPLFYEIRIFEIVTETLSNDNTVSGI